MRNQSFLCCGRSVVAALKLEGIDGKAPSGAEPAACERVGGGGGGTGVCIDRVSVCTFKTSACVPAPSAPSPHFSYMRAWCAWCRYTRGRFERTHGDVLNVHTGVFTCFSPCRTTNQAKPSQATPHTKHTPRPQRHNTETETEREREDETRQEGKTREERR